MKKFTIETLADIISWIRNQVEINNSPGHVIEFIVSNPDLGIGRYSGELNSKKLPHRSLKNWQDLAEYLDCRLLLPQPVDEMWVKIRLQIVDKNEDWHHQHFPDKSEKYGANSTYFRINKLEEPTFLFDYTRLLQQIQIKPGWRVLNLGVNKGDEFVALKNVMARDCFESLELTGIDFSQSAIDVARNRFSGKNHRFICADINTLANLSLGQFDLIISIGTLQSPGIDRQNLLRQLVQAHVGAESALIFGFPNSRYFDGEIKYGAHVKNYSEPELSLLVKDIMFYKKYLQQHKFKVQVSGKYYILLFAIR
ncbi:MAG: class I SAM-dependent methyltransferase [Calditrichaeota bacterium]|nr:MAG: class I SAM-dependent methyltransferase [Calditrichota bacterium]